MLAIIISGLTINYIKALPFNDGVRAFRFKLGNNTLAKVSGVEGDVGHNAVLAVNNSLHELKIRGIGPIWMDRSPRDLLIK